MAGSIQRASSQSTSSAYSPAIQWGRCLWNSGRQAAAEVVCRSWQGQRRYRHAVVVSVGEDGLQDTSLFMLGNHGGRGRREVLPSPCEGSPALHRVRSWDHREWPPACFLLDKSLPQMHPKCIPLAFQLMACSQNKQHVVNSVGSRLSQECTGRPPGKQGSVSHHSQVMSNGRATQEPGLWSIQQVSLM